jgi:hypothetical protein
MQRHRMALHYAILPQPRATKRPSLEARATGTARRHKTIERRKYRDQVAKSVAFSSSSKCVFSAVSHSCPTSPCALSPIGREKSSEPRIIFEASWQAAGEHPDVLEANARHEALSERWSELAMRVATMPAKTMEGLIAKIALIASGYAEDDLDGTYDGILASAALDAQALANARETRS